MALAQQLVAAVMENGPAAMAAVQHQAMYGSGQENPYVSPSTLEMFVQLFLWAQVGSRCQEGNCSSNHWSTPSVIFLNRRWSAPSTWWAV